jgi:hypothetical protein
MRMFPVRDGLARVREVCVLRFVIEADVRFAIRHNVPPQRLVI